MLTKGDALIDPLPLPFSGAMTVPGDKSISHRAVLFSAMAEGTSRISGVLDSEDVRSSVRAVTALGAHANLSVQPDGSLAGEITGWGAAGPQQPKEPIDCGNSGTTVRLLMGIIAPWDISVELTGDASLRHRPMRRIANPLTMMGARFEPEDRDTLPLRETGTRGLLPLAYDMPVASAQLKTSVLLAGVFAAGVTELREPAASRNHTELMLPAYGVPVEAGECFARVEGPCAMHAANVTVPGDPSSAAFPVCAAVMKQGSNLEVRNVSLSPTRIGFVKVLQSMGAQVRTEQTGAAGGEEYGSIHASYADGLHACEIAAYDIASLVDEIPVLALVAATAQGTTVFRQVGELRVKETDRLAAIIDGLSILGVRAWAEGDDLFVEGVPGLLRQEGETEWEPGAEGSMPPCVFRGYASAFASHTFDSLGDHRLAMTWALVAFCGNRPVIVRNFDSVNISYPTFLSDMQRMAQ